MNIRQQLDESLQKFEQLERDMADPAVLADSSKIATVMREHGALSKMAQKYRHYRKLSDEIRDLTTMSESEDSDERAMAEEELTRVRAEREVLWKELLDFTIGGEDANRSRCVFEIRAGTGGEEAALFARDLFTMYNHHAANKGWKVEVMDSSISERGGFKEVVMALEGEGVYREMQFESGVIECSAYRNRSSRSCAYFCGNCCRDA